MALKYVRQKMKFLSKKLMYKSMLLSKKNRVDLELIRLAQSQKTTKEEIAAAWTREQMKSLVDILMVRKRCTGTQIDLDESIKYCSKILPYLQKIKDTDRKSTEDQLLKLAVEGGDYCTRGIKRASGELLRHVLEQDNVLKANPMEDYERKVQEALQQVRSRIVQERYKAYVDGMQVPGRISSDVHGYDMYRLFFSMGFYPLTPYERESFGVFHIVSWSFYYQEEHHPRMFADFKKELNEAVKQVGVAYLSTYMQQFIEGNNKLTEAQKEEIHTVWLSESGNETFIRLLLVNMGVLIPKPRPGLRLV